MQVLGDWYLVFSAWCLVLGAWYLVFSAWCLVLGAWCFGTNIFQEPRTKPQSLPVLRVAKLISSKRSQSPQGKRKGQLS